MTRALCLLLTVVLIGLPTVAFAAADCDSPSEDPSQVVPTGNPSLTPAMSSFGVMRMVVRPGFKALVTLATGEQLTGRITYAFGDSLGLDVKGVERRFDENEVCRIEVWKPYRLGESAGLGIGLVLSPAIFDVMDGSQKAPIADAYVRHPVRVLKLSAAAAGIGMLLAKVLPGRHLLAYERGSLAERPDLSVTPMVSTELAGVVVSVGWK